MTEQKTYDIEPDWKHFFWSYILSILAIPLAGVGLIALYFVRKKHKSIRYRVTDSQIKAIDQKYEHNVDLVDINQVEIEQTSFQETLGIAALLLHTSASEMRLVGISNPERLKKILEQGIEAEKKRQEQKKETKPREPSHGPGNMERIDYLTGLWQQGLITDEEYKSEKKQFE